MKIMNKKKLRKIFIAKNKVAYNAIETEIAILKKLVKLFFSFIQDHPNIVRLYEIIDDPKHDKLYLVTELVKNGTILQKSNKKALNYEESRKYFR